MEIILAVVCTAVGFGIIGFVMGILNERNNEKGWKQRALDAEKMVRELLHKETKRLVGDANNMIDKLASDVKIIKEKCPIAKFEEEKRSIIVDSILRVNKDAFRPILL